MSQNFFFFWWGLQKERKKTAKRKKRGRRARWQEVKYKGDHGGLAQVVEIKDYEYTTPSIVLLCG